MMVMQLMIQCDNCSGWFHGHCVGISDIQGEYLTSQKLPFFCPSCVSSSGIGHLPGFLPAPVFSFQWGELESADFSEHLL